MSSKPVPLQQLVHDWRAEAKTLEKRGAAGHAATLTSCADDLERCLEEWEQVPLTLSEAAELSGYSSDHLGRLVRDGKLSNAGRRGSPRIRRQDLPVKPGAMAAAPTHPHVDRTQIVRSAITGD